MTNCNEKLDEILHDYAMNLHEYANGVPGHYNDYREQTEQAKQSITSLIKEMVAEAKPEEYEDYYASNPVEKGRKMGYNEASREFEQNLLKALEEV